MTGVQTCALPIYRITAQNRTTSAILRDYGMTQITGSSWTLDGYDSSTAVLPVSTITVGTITMGAVGTGASCTVGGSSPSYVLNCTIPAGPTTAVNWRGAWAAITAYAKNDGFVQGGNGYIVVTAYTSGGSYGSTDTANAVQVATGCPLTGCTLSGPLLLPGNPTNLQAATKQYVDASTGTALPLAGGTQTGAVYQAAPFTSAEIGRAHV